MQYASNAVHSTLDILPLPLPAFLQDLGGWWGSSASGDLCSDLPCYREGQSDYMSKASPTDNVTEWTQGLRGSSVTVDS